MSEREVRDALAPLRGRYFWGARAGAEELLSFEIGEPTLEVTEHQTRAGVRRAAHARGRWRLSLVDCRFEVAVDGETRATDEHSRDVIARAGEELCGQALTSVALRGDELDLRFDLGATLRIWSHPASSPGATLWELAGPEGSALFRR